RVAVLLVSAQHLAQLLRHGDGDVEVGAGQNLGLACGEPALRLISMTLGTAPVLAGMVGVDLGAALVAAPEMSAECFSAASEDVGDAVQSNVFYVAPIEQPAGAPISHGNRVFGVTLSPIEKALYGRPS